MTDVGLNLPVQEPVPRWETATGASKLKVVEKRFPKGILLFLLVTV